jgi:hypothetical protein
MPRRSNPVIAEILRQGANQPRRRVLAALTTGAVESSFRNLSGGDADSQGWRQERASLYKNPRNLKASVRRFYAEAAQHDRGQSVGALAADVQRPRQEFRGRYAQHLGEARKILGSGGGGVPGTPGSTIVTPGSIKVAGPGTAVDVAKALQQMRASDQAARPTLTAPALPDLIAPKDYAGNAAVMALDAPRRSAPAEPQLKGALGRLSSLHDKVTEISLSRATTQGIPGTPGTSGGSVKGGSKIKELIFNDGGKGYAIKNGQRVDGRSFYSDVWAGHAGHVHVAAGPKTTVRLGKLAQSMGLHVGENPHFGGVTPVHVAGSNHYRGEAIDVSGDKAKMRAFARAVEGYQRSRR